MPQYEYRCSSCDLEFVVCRKMKDMEKIEECPECLSHSSLMVSKGVTLGDEVGWINDEVRGSLQDPSEMRRNPITTRTELNRAVKAKGLVEVS